MEGLRVRSRSTTELGLLLYRFLPSPFLRGEGDLEYDPDLDRERAGDGLRLLPPRTGGVTLLLLLGGLGLLRIRE